MSPISLGPSPPRAELACRWLLSGGVDGAAHSYSCVFPGAVTVLAFIPHSLLHPLVQIKSQVSPPGLGLCPYLWLFCLL